MKYCSNCGFKLTDDTPLVSEAPQRGLGEAIGTENEVLEGYVGENSGVAVPKVSDYRERYKKHRLKASDVKTNAPILPLKDMDGELSQFGDLVIGPGIEQEY